MKSWGVVTANFRGPRIPNNGPAELCIVNLKHVFHRQSTGWAVAAAMEQGMLGKKKRPHINKVQRHSKKHNMSCC